MPVMYTPVNIIADGVLASQLTMCAVAFQYAAPNGTARTLHYLPTLESGINRLPT